MLWAAGVAASPLGATLGVAARSRGPRAGQAGPDDSRPSRRVRDRRPRDARRRGRQAAARRCAGRDPDGHARGRQHPARDRAASRCAPFRYRDLGNMATIGRASAVADFGWLRLKRLDRLARVAVRPHLEPDRLPQPDRGDRAVGVGLLQLPARGAADHRRRRPRHEARPDWRAGPRARRRRPRRSCRSPRPGRALVFARALPAAAAVAHADVERRAGRAVRLALCLRSSPRSRRASARARGWRRRDRRRVRVPPVERRVVLYLAFLALWGLNYRRVPLTEKLVTIPAADHARAAVALANAAATALNSRRTLPRTRPARGLACARGSFHDAQRALGASQGAVPGVRSDAARRLFPPRGDCRDDRSVLPRNVIAPRTCSTSNARSSSRMSGRTWPATRTSRKRTSSRG